MHSLRMRKRLAEKAPLVQILREWDMRFFDGKRFLQQLSHAMPSHFEQDLYAPADGVRRRRRRWKRLACLGFVTRAWDGM